VRVRQQYSVSGAKKEAIFACLMGRSHGIWKALYDHTVSILRIDVMGGIKKVFQSVCKIT